MKRGPTAVFLEKETTNLSQDSIALCHQITTLDRTKLTKKIGALPPKDLQAIEDGIKAAIDPV